jgi:hypothetical protein
MIAAIGFLAFATLGKPGSVYGQEQDNIFKQGAKLLGFATDVAPPADFVQKSRPSGDLDYLPIFQPPPEPSRPAMKSDDLKKMKVDLDALEKAHNALRQAYPPATKALSDQVAKQKAQSKTPEAQQ